MSRVETQGYSKMIDLAYGGVRYTLVVQNNRHAAYTATGITPASYDTHPPADPVEAARYCFEHDYDLDVDDKWFINRWLELVTDRSGGEPKPRTEEDPDFQPGDGVVKYGKLKGV